jgi:phage terminase small subunit
MADAPKPPTGLGNSGRALWRQIARALPADWELDEREEALLRLASRQADDLTRLETAIAKDGAMVRGSAGQPVVNPAIVEARQARLAISRLLGSLHLPDADEDPRSAAGRRGQEAAKARWGQRNAERGRQRAAIEGEMNGTA